MLYIHGINIGFFGREGGTVMGVGVRGCLMQITTTKQKKIYNKNDAYAFKVMSSMLDQTFFWASRSSTFFLIFSFHPLFTCHVS